MKTEADLGRWLETLSAGRAGCVFTSDVADTLSVLQQAATSEREPLVIGRRAGTQSDHTIIANCSPDENEVLAKAEASRQLS